MAKRANGQGTVYKRADGRWEGRISYTDPDTGQRRRQAVYGKTQRAALAEMKKIRDRLDAGQPARDASVTLAAFLGRWRVTTLKVSDRAPSTRSLYDALARKHLEAAPIGAVALDKLRPRRN